MEDQVKDGSEAWVPRSERVVLLSGEVPGAVSRSLARWGYKTLDFPARERPSQSDGVVAVVIDGSKGNASDVLRWCRDEDLPSVLIQAPAFLLGEGHAGVIYREYPGPEEVRRAINRLTSCPAPRRSTPIPTEPVLAFLRARFGLVFPPRRSAELKEAVRQRMTALRLPTASSYLQRLERAPAGDREPDHLLETLLVGETYLYRTAAHFETLRNLHLPRVLARHPETGIRAWSAGCSTGDEAYCLGALLLSELPPHRVSVLGTDVNMSALEAARGGHFQAYSQREPLPGDLRAHFDTREGVLSAGPTLRRCTRFEYLNLAAWANGTERGPDGEFDVIFCRNVLLYFAPEVARKVMRRLARQLRPGGCLFLGPSETVLGGDTDLEVRAGLDCFYLARPAPTAPEQRPPAPARARPPSAPPPPPREPSSSVLELVTPPWHRPAAAPEPEGEVAEPERRARAGFELMDLEDFQAARAAFEAARMAEPKHHGARLGLLFLEANEGNYRVAAAGCNVLAEEGSTQPELFYLLGLLADLEGQLDRAERHFQRALFLDAGCYMARLKLAELLQRRGDRTSASLEAQNLLAQLRELAPGALVPLSGGMAREALEAFCLALVAAGSES